MTDVSLNIYMGIYDTIAGNLKESGREFGYKRETFRCDVGSSPQEVEVSRFLELENEEFYQAVFVSAFKRLPEEKEFLRFRDKLGTDKRVFQKAVLKNIAGSSVFAINHMRMVDNPYFEQKRGVKYFLIGRLYGLTDKSSLREFGKKLPKPIQKIIRKVFL